MKKLLGIILISLFFAIGCQENESILEPNSEYSEAPDLLKGRPILIKDYDYLKYDSLATVKYDDNKQLIVK